MIKFILEGRVLCKTRKNILQKSELTVVKEYGLTIM